MLSLNSSNVQGLLPVYASLLTSQPSSSWGRREPQAFLKTGSENYGITQRQDLTKAGRLMPTQVHVYGRKWNEPGPVWFARMRKSIPTLLTLRLQVIYG